MRAVDIIDKKKNIEIEYLDTSSILEGHILGTQKIYLSEAPSRAQRKVKNKTIIYSLVRPNQNHYGILYNTPDNFIVSTGFATIDLKEEFKETIDADFLFLLLTQKQITHYLHRIAENSASAYPSLIPSDIAKLELNFPSIKKQKNIARLIQNINEKIELNRSINHNLRARREQRRIIFSLCRADAVNGDVSRNFVENARHRLSPGHSSKGEEVSHVA